MTSPAICLLYEDATAPAAVQLARRLAAEAVNLRELTASTLEHRQAIVVDIDLALLDSVALLRQALKPGKMSGAFLFGVEAGARAHASRAQAAALGAKILLPRPMQPADVLAALAELNIDVPPAAPTLADQPGGASIIAAGRVLDQAFKTISSGEAVDMRGAIDAGRELIAGVGSAGLSGWLDTVRGHHEGTFQHCLVVTGAAVAYARAANIPERGQLTLIVAALLHDIGKAELPVEILDKPGKLTAAEFDIIKTHPRIAEAHLQRQNNVPPAIVDAVAHHHEYLDGSGYPDGLAGTQISPMTRILTVCDIYGALLERRAYKEPKPPAQAVLILVDMARLGKIDYNIVRQLAQTVGETLPARPPYLA